MTEFRIPSRFASWSARICGWPFVIQLRSMAEAGQPRTPFNFRVLVLLARKRGRSGSLLCQASRAGRNLRAGVYPSRLAPAAGPSSNTSQGARGRPHTINKGN